MNNVKGDAELSVLKALGFVLDLKGYSIEAGIKLHGEGHLASAQVGMYGLVPLKTSSTAAHRLLGTITEKAAERRRQRA